MSLAQLVTPVKSILAAVRTARDDIIKQSVELACQICKLAAIRVLNNVEHDRLVIICPSILGSSLFSRAEHHAFPSDAKANDDNVRTATLTVKHPLFWFRLATQGDIGFAEAYMYGEVECSDLVTLFQVLMGNRACLTGIDTPLAKLARVLERLFSTHLVNNLPTARRNISAHYDISNEMFMAFLSRDMTYSCAIFPGLDADIKDRTSLSSPTDTQPSSVTSSVSGSSTSSGRSSRSCVKTTRTGLESFVYHAVDEGEGGDDSELFDAQIQKMLHIVRRADIKPGHRVLEIGTGWGSMAILIAQNFPGVTIDTLTLSEEQADLAEQRAREMGLGPQLCTKCANARAHEDGEEGAVPRVLPEDSDVECTCLPARVRIHLMDYRSMPKEWEGVFDRVISVEMVEAVGHEFLQTYWAQIDWALRKDTGVGVVQGITIPESRFDPYVRDTDFIRKWVLFPGGFLPTISLLVSSMTDGSKGRLIAESMDNIGPHYARTLREWRRRFEARFDEEIVPALKEQYPDVLGDGAEGSREEIEVFRRKWVYYFAYCEVGFASRILGDHIITFTREGNVQYGCQVMGNIDYE